MSVRSKPVKGPDGIDIGEYAYQRTAFSPIHFGPVGSKAFHKAKRDATKKVRSYSFPSLGRACS